MKSTVRLIKLAPILLNMYVAIVLTLSLMDVEVVSFDYVLGHSVYVDIIEYCFGICCSISRNFNHFIFQTWVL